MFKLVPVAEPDDARQDALIEAAVKTVQKYGLEVPAVFLGEAMKPMSFAAGQFVHAFAFLPAAIWQNEDDWQQVAFILSDRERLEKLLRRLDSHLDGT